MSIEVTTIEGPVESVPVETATSEDTDQDENTESESQDDETSEDSDTHESEESEDDSEDENEEESEDEEEKEEPKKPKRRSGFKKRLDKLGQRISDRDTEIESLRRQLSDRDSQREETKEPVKAEASDRPVRPIEDDFETYEDFIKAEDKYQDDRSDWKFKQNVKNQEQESKASKQESEYKTSIDTHTQRINEFKKTTPDFDTIVQEGLTGMTPTEALESEVLNSEVSAELIYTLAKDPEELDRINALAPMRLAKEIGKLEAKILMNSSSKDIKTLKRTNAPKPLGKVGTKGKSSKKSIYDADISQADFERQMKERSKNK